MDPFAVLGLDPDADDETIKRAYRQRAKETHPDHGGSVTEFKRVRDAYEAIQAGEIDREGDHETGGFADNFGPDVPDPHAPDPEPDTEVTYLNYAVLAERGWSLEDDDLFEKAARADLADRNFGQFTVEGDQSLLEAAEDAGHAWPFACRGGACANCAVAVTDGEIEMPAGQILTQEYIDQGIRLSCISAPTTDDTQVVFNVKHLPGLEELLLPASRFDKARSSSD